VARAKERLYSLREFPAVLKEHGPIERSYECLRLWVRNGKIIDGELRLLRTKPIGNVLYTKMSWFLKFLGEDAA
jgi:hypothetical protein